MRKEYSNLVWEELVFAFIGGYFAKEIKDEINGLVINCKKDFNTLQIWTKSFNEEVTSGIEKNIREILSIPKEVVLDIKPFNMPNKEYNNYNNYNNYKGNYQKKRQNNNYYKKYENNNNKDYKYNEKNKDGNKIENEVKEEKEKEEKKDEIIIEKKESKESKNSKDMETPKEKEDYKEVKKKKKKKKD